MNRAGTMAAPARTDVRLPDVSEFSIATPPRLPAPIRALFRLPAFALLGLIRVYQHTLSPVLPVITMGRCACRFAPSCSHYALEVVRTHGAFAGAWLALKRLAKCTPLHPGGIDLPPPVRRTGSRPVCRATS